MPRVGLPEAGGFRPAPAPRAWFLACLALLGWAAACAELAVPELRARVTDLSATLTADQASALETKLAAFEERRGAQVAVLMVPSTRPEAIEQYAIRVAEAWRLGRKGVDDGALLVIATEDRALRIEVGYGLEGALTDATSRRIIDEVIVPRFREGDFYGGIDAGTDRMLAVIAGESLPEPERRGPVPGLDALVPLLPVVLIFAVTLGAILKRLFGQLVGSLVTAGAVGAFTWLLVGIVAVAAMAALAAFFLSLASRAGPGRWASGRRGGFGGGYGGDYGGGGIGGGGGFGGGGGGFGGGGSSGRW
jgi:uncharacterized protein